MPRPDRLARALLAEDSWERICQILVAYATKSASLIIHPKVIFSSTRNQHRALPDHRRNHSTWLPNFVNATAASGIPTRVALFIAETALRSGKVAGCSSLELHAWVMVVQDLPDGVHLERDRSERFMAPESVDHPQPTTLRRSARLQTGSESPSEAHEAVRPSSGTSKVRPRCSTYRKVDREGRPAPIGHGRRIIVWDPNALAILAQKRDTLRADARLHKDQEGRDVIRRGSMRLLSRSQAAAVDAVCRKSSGVMEIYLAGRGNEMEEEDGGRCLEACRQFVNRLANDMERHQYFRFDPSAECAIRIERWRQ